MRDVAQRPQALVGEAGVVAGLLLRREPDAADLVEGMLRRHGDAVVRSTVSRSAEPLPCAIQVPEQARITGSSAVTRPLAGRCTWMPSGVRTWMYGSRLETTITSLPCSLAAQRRAQRLLVPDALAAVERPVLALEVADQLAQVARDRPQLRRRGSRRRPQDAFAAQQRAQSCTQPRHDSCAMTTVISAMHARQRDEEVEQVAARLLAAALDEAHVVHEHELAPRADVAGDRAHRDVQDARAGPQHVLAAVGIGAERRAAQFAREMRGRDRRALSDRGTARPRTAARPAASG